VANGHDQRLFLLGIGYDFASAQLNGWWIAHGGRG
jgi:hypothetical protein